MRIGHFDIVTIKTDRPGQLLNVTNTRQVAELLTGPWPAQFRGKTYASAMKACMDHMEGKKSAEAVRKAFIDAAKDARLFIGEGKHGA